MGITCYRQGYIQVIRRQQQDSNMNFAVPFLKMLALYMLWIAQFLLESYAVYQISVLLPLYAKIWDQKVSQKVRKLILLLAKIQRKLARTSRKRAHTFHSECLHLRLKEFTPANIGLPT